jgi:hypothetical protein
MIVFALSGKAQSGKDTFYQFVSEYAAKNGLNSTRIAFADAVKEVAYMLGWDGKKDDKGRKLLQMIGTDVGRAYNPNVWVDKGIEKLKFEQLCGTDIVCFTDCRFPNEIDDLKRLDWIVGQVISVRIERERAGAGVNANHPSECGLDNYKFDRVIWNKGDKEDYKNIVYSILNDLKK